MDSNQGRHHGQSGSLGAAGHQSALKIVASSSSTSTTPMAGSNQLTHSGRNISSLPPSGKLQLRSESTSLINQSSFQSAANNLTQIKKGQSRKGGNSADQEENTFNQPIETDSLRIGPTSNRGGKLAQSEQLAQPLNNSRPLLLNTMPATLNQISTATQAIEGPIQQQKKQRKFKDHDSSPGIPLRNSMKNSDQLRQSQKIFSNQSYTAKRSNQKAPGLNGGSSAQISEMHKTSGSPSKAAKVAHITYHQNTPVQGGTLQVGTGFGENMRGNAISSKKNSSRNSGSLMHQSIGKSLGGTLFNNLPEGSQDNHVQMANHPTNNINSIVLQTSPAKFFQGSHSHMTSVKKTMGLQRNNQHPPQPEQSSINFNEFSNSNSLRINSTNVKQGVNSNDKQQLFQQSAQQYTLFQPTQQFQQQQPSKSKASSMGGPTSSIHMATQLNFPHSNTQRPAKHYSQVLVNNGQLSQPQVKPAGIPAKSEKTNSMSSLQHTQSSSIAYQGATTSSNAYANYPVGQNSNTNNVQKSASGMSLNLNNNNRSSTAPISQAQLHTGQQTPGTGTGANIDTSLSMSTKHATAVKTNFTTSNNRTFGAANKANLVSGVLKQPKKLNLNSTTAGNQSFTMASQGSIIQHPKTVKNAFSPSSVDKSYPNLSRVLLKHFYSSSKSSNQSTAAKNSDQKLKSTKSNLSLIQTSFNQVVVPTSTVVSNRSVSKFKYDQISPRNSHASAAQVKSTQVLHSLTQKEEPLFEGSQISEEIRCIKFDLPNQSVVKGDSERARFIAKEHHVSMQQILTYFCKHESLAYKQGMNDITAPFLWLAIQKHIHKDKSSKSQRNSSKKKKPTNNNTLQTSFTSVGSQIDLEEPYLMMREFVNTFQTNIFIDNDFYALHSCLQLLKILLTYHDPTVFKHLEDNYVVPAMYSIPWFITYFATRMESAELVLQFWDRIMEQKDGDVTFIFFFAVALIIYNRSKILMCDQADLPQAMTELRITSFEQLIEIVRLAEHIEENTPFSFRNLHEMKSLFIKQSSETLKEICSRLESLSCMPLLPAELFFYSFPGEIDCSDPECSNSLTWRQDKRLQFAPLLPQTYYATRRRTPNKQNDCNSSMKTGKASDSEEYIQSVISSFANNTSNNSVSLGQSRLPATLVGGFHRSAAHPLETESNLNYEQDYQESPIDLINETARMKHLNSEDFRSFGEKQGGYGSQQDGVIVEQLYEEQQRKNTVLPQIPESCIRCVQKQRVTQQLEEKGHHITSTSLGQVRSKEDSSFEDLNTDVLYSRFRFVIVDCRLNTLQQEVTLQHCITFEVLAASRAEQLKNQIKSLLDYKDSYHICLLGLDQNEDLQKDPFQERQQILEKTGKISIRQFHEYVLRFLIDELIKQGFKYVSTLPGGFQQVHDLAQLYGFQLIDHEEMIDGAKKNEESTIELPITVSLTNCYHCLAQKNRKKRTLEHQNSMVIKKYGSMINTLDNASLGGTPGLPHELQLEKRDKSVPDDTKTIRESMTIEEDMNINDTPFFQETTAYQGQKFDLIGFADYFPFGLKQMYAAGASLSKMLKAPSEEEAKMQRPLSTEHENGSISKGNGQSNKIEEGPERLTNVSRSRYRQIHINSVAMPRQQSSESAYVGIKSNPLASNHLNVGMARSAGKSSGGSACRKTATQQNQQHLQLQAKYKLMSKVPDFKSQFLMHKEQSSSMQIQNIQYDEVEDDKELSMGDAKVPNRFSQVLSNHRELGRTAEIHRLSSPIRRNRPRITNEVQSQDKDIAELLQKMQHQKKITHSVTEQSGLEEKRQADRVEIGLETETTGGVNEPLQHGVAESNIASSYLGSQVSENQENLPELSPQLESYLLNGIVAQIQISQTNYNELISKYESGHIFTATRLIYRKRKFLLKNQHHFDYEVPSQILITPFTVAIIQKCEDIEKAVFKDRERKNISIEWTAFNNAEKSTPQGENDNSDVKEKVSHEADKETMRNKERTTDHLCGKSAVGVDQPQDENMQYALLQSRFFMYDLIKITSRKLTTKIITFYYRIPKKAEYDERILEDQEMIWKLNKKPACHYSFAFKRAEFEEVAMSFEFEREEEAKECINSVSSLYKQLKDQQKKQSRRIGTASGTSNPQHSRGSQPSGNSDRRVTQKDPQISQLKNK